MRIPFVLVWISVLAPLVAAQSQSEPNLMPLPASFQLGSDRLRVDQSFSVALTGHREPRLDRAVERFLRRLLWQTGMPLQTRPTGTSKATFVIRTEHASKEVQEPGEDESYDLEVRSSGAKLSAPNPLGTMHGLETFLQLVEVTPDGFATPGIVIHDKPRFVWRGLLIDVSRHFMPVDVLQRTLDGMAAVKLNTLHCHLSDNQGFRIESKKLPKLHEMGSDGLYYTQDEIRDLIAYARDRGIRIVPEFDMPGHSTSWFAGYPELASAPGPYQIERTWGVFDPAMDPTRDRTYKLLDEFIGEMAHLFPDPYFHIGGDEVNGKQWDQNPDIQKFMRSHSLRNNGDLQAYFNQRLQTIVARHGKIMMGWDEVLHPNLPKSIVIQSWRGQASLAEAAQRGYRGLLSYGYYLDLIWPAERHYAVDPMADAAASLTAEQKQLILGGEACMWTEYVSPETIDSRVWPRLAAIAERLWSPPEVRDINSMYERLEDVSWRLGWLGLTHNSSYIPMLRRLAGTEDVSALRVLADVVEPVKDYLRSSLSNPLPTSATPLNQLVDAVRPESETARRFADFVNQAVAGGRGATDAKARIRELLAKWRDNDAKLQPLLKNSFLLKDSGALSADLSALGAAGLQALDYLDAGKPAPDSWRAEQTALLARAQKPYGLLLLMVAPPVQKLIDASARKGATQPQ